MADFFSCLLKAAQLTILFLKRFFEIESWVRMRTLYDVQQLLKKFGIIVYIGNRMADLELMELELRGLYQSKLVETRDFEMALLIIRQEKRKEKEKRNRG